MREFVLTDFAEVCEPSHDIGRTLRSFLRFRVYEIRRRLGSEATEADGLLLEGRLVGAAGLSKGLIAALEADRAT